MDDTHSVMCVAPDDATENDNRDYWVMALVTGFMLVTGVLALLNG